MLKRLVIMRHGSAAMIAPNDALRPLTEAGELEAHRASRVFPFEPKVIYHSALVRAEQTARILASYYPKAILLSAEWLVPEASPHDVLGQLRDSEEDIVLVSHQPLVSGLAALLLHGSTRYAHDVPFLRPANFMHLHAEVLEAGCGVLINTHL